MKTCGAGSASSSEQKWAEGGDTGTNYYWYGDCRECGQLQKLHIGKSSAGWYFLLHVIPGVIDNLEDWEKRFEDEDSFILDEYRNPVSPKVMRNTVCVRNAPRSVHTGDFMRSNYAEMGKNNLVRFVEGLAHCIGHGEGPWSYITGEFS